MVDAGVSSQPFIEGRGKDFCRGCLESNLFSALNLGDLPIANELLLEKSSLIEKFSLHLKICASCGLGQVADVVTPERIFRDYRYLSSMSSTFLQHASDFVKERLRDGSLASGDWVLEIASNDGYLLRNFIGSGIRIVGIEPAKNVAEISRGLGIETISEFFSSALAKELLSIYGYPKLIIANNVMAHVPDLIDFITGLEILCGPTTQVSIENPSLENILNGMQFDTIYHEHYSYLTASAVKAISQMHGLQLFKVENLPTHGGSNRYWLRKFNEDDFLSKEIEAICQLEYAKGLFDPDTWAMYANKVNGVMEGFRKWLRSGINSDLRIYGYGAAAKASTILNSLDVDDTGILAIADISLEKQKRFMPPDGIKIISPEELFTEMPTDIVIFPWNIENEIAAYLRFNLDRDVRLWSVIPGMHEIKP